ncbi:MAG: hypothetical protein H7X77_02535 [Anaerolineae bacterium]|nr:hypothetical protein [Anaerolineae bacterium]
MPPQLETPDSTSFLTRHRILLAMVGGGVFILILIGITLTQPSRGISVISNVMLTCLCLLPMVICLLPIYLLLVVAIYGMNRVHGSVETQLHRAQDASVSLIERSNGITDSLNRSSINFSALLAHLDPLFNIFDRPKSDGDELDVP